MRHFNEDDKVVVYDNFKKLNFPGIVKEVLGKNNYLVEIDGLNKHVLVTECLMINLQI